MAPSPGLVLAGPPVNATTPYDADAAKFGLNTIYIVNTVLSGLVSVEAGSMPCAAGR